MKKIIMLAFFMCLFMFSYGQDSQFSIHGGYSWTNGIIGAEYQTGKLGFSGGWMPTKMPISGKEINNIGFSLNFYGEPIGYSCYYASLGYSSAAIRIESSSGDSKVLGTPVASLGYKLDIIYVYLKGSVGYSWHKDLDGGVWTYELLFAIPLYLL